MGGLGPSRRDDVVVTPPVPSTVSTREVTKVQGSKVWVKRTPAGRDSYSVDRRVVLY